MKKLLSIILALFMLMALAPMGMAKTSPEEVAVAADPVNPEALRSREVPVVDENEIVTFMVKLKDSPVADKVKDVDSRQAADLTAIIMHKQDSFEKKLQNMFGSDTEYTVKFRYQLLFNGFSIEGPRSMMSKIAELPEVDRVYIAPAGTLP